MNDLNQHLMLFKITFPKYFQRLSITFNSNLEISSTKDLCETPPRNIMGWERNSRRKNKQ